MICLDTNGNLEKPRITSGGNSENFNLMDPFAS
jgi:hypothetical protein